MTEHECDIIKSDEAQILISDNIENDPQRLSLSLKCNRALAVAVCSQIKYLQKAKDKLPSYYAAKAIITPLAYQQCSSEAAAATKNYNGNICIDLTCGLGVDSLHFSKHFSTVISVEQDKLRSEIAAHNFKKLGAENITVIHNSAENFIADYHGEVVDLVYIDPARRDDSDKRLFLIEDCSPNVFEILPTLLNIAKKIVVKNSPLYDIEQALRVFSQNVASVEVVTVGDECKELLVELEKSPTQPKVIVNIANSQKYSFETSDIKTEKSVEPRSLNSFQYLLIPDVGFYKGRLTTALFRKYFLQYDVYLPESDGFAFSENAIDNFCGKILKIESITEYQPKAIKRNFKEHGVKRLNILKKNFRHSTEDIKKALGVAEGGNTFGAFFTIDRKMYMALVVPLKK